MQNRPHPLHLSREGPLRPLRVHPRLLQRLALPQLRVQEMAAVTEDRAPAEEARATDLLVVPDREEEGARFSKSVSTVKTQIPPKSEQKTKISLRQAGNWDKPRRPMLSK